jgi:predicted lysophospholipase L1 biosynthesis ABC-type transport system permease subunit
MIEQAWVALGVLAGLVVGLSAMPIFGLMEGYSGAQIFEQTFRKDWFWQSMAAHTFFALLYGFMGGFFVHNHLMHRRNRVELGE